MNNEVIDLAKVIAKEITKEFEEKHYNEQKIQQKEFFKRLDKYFYMLNVTFRILAICGSIFGSIWVYCYFTTPYLTKYYSNIQNSTGNFNIQNESGADNVGLVQKDFPTKRWGWWNIKYFEKEKGEVGWILQKKN
ncbi:hypothetical protein [Clostridium cellulovorans]|uniref:Uncharacterized protein n=1 Tax=Clostridium cellulovorans (strain ATCC 35296 / DSM 3052 / OCM 3 / 743B) TaxID=573061 RepID=D9SVZ1_CLOC7|nr:hypothetical protein [Clostridium cellulovorans]ADL53202.1 hypothetical protein Clocel_3526 [Clostridium cellulovorans 743B]